MPSSLALIALYCSLVLAASLAGGMVPLLIRLTHNRIQLSISFVAGFMLGVAVLLLLPHAIMESQAGPAVATVSAVQWLLVGLLAMFFIERFFSFHHHDAPDELAAAEVMRHDQAHNHNHAHAHAQGHGAPAAGTSLTWSGAAVGLTLHSIIDGVALAAAVEAGQQSGHGLAAGLAVFLVVLLHKPFDSMTLVTLMGLGGWSMPWRHAINGVFALTLLVGVTIFHLAKQSLGGPWMELEGNSFVNAALAFSAGTFLCIALSDLLPELQFHRHDRLKLSSALLLGVALAWGVSFFEAQAHDHAGHEHADHAAQAGHEH